MPVSAPRTVLPLATDKLFGQRMPMPPDIRTTLSRDTTRVDDEC